MNGVFAALQHSRVNLFFLLSPLRGGSNHITASGRVPVDGARSRLVVGQTVQVIPKVNSVSCSGLCRKLYGEKIIFYTIFFVLTKNTDLSLTFRCFIYHRGC